MKMNKEKQLKKFQYKQLKEAMMENVFWDVVKLKIKIKTSANITHSTSVMKENMFCANNQTEDIKFICIKNLLN